MQRVLGIAGYSGSGKTTLIEKLLPELARLGLRVSVIKHTHHDVEFESPGKDSARFRRAGACDVMLVSPHRYAIVHELPDGQFPTLAEQLARLAPVDLVLVEGFKHETIPKIEVWRADNGRPRLYPQDTHVMALASDVPQPEALPQLDLNDAQGIARFIQEFIQKPFTENHHA